MGLLARFRGRSEHSGTKAAKPHVHAVECLVDLSGGIYKCKCGKACIYVNRVLTELTFDNMGDNDKGKTINGIYQF